MRSRVLIAHSKQRARLYHSISRCRWLFQYKRLIKKCIHCSHHRRSAIKTGTLRKAGDRRTTRETLSKQAPVGKQRLHWYTEKKSRAGASHTKCLNFYRLHQARRLSSIRVKKRVTTQFFRRETVALSQPKTSIGLVSRIDPHIYIWRKSLFQQAGGNCWLQTGSGTLRRSGEPSLTGRFCFHNRQQHLAGFP